MISVEGGGWGHGVGMSQYGALGRASSGASYSDILSFYYPGAQLTTVEDLQNIRVHIHSAGGTRVNPVDAPAGDPADDIEIVDRDNNLIFNSRNGNALTIDKVAGGFTIMRQSGGVTENVCLARTGVDLCQVDQLRLRYVQGNPVKVDAIDRVSIGSTGQSYQWGELRITERDNAPNSTLWVVVANLTLDQYMYGLAEVPASWPEATLQTQAVAGRTYGYDRARSRRASSAWDKPWDLYSTIDDQVYNGIAKEIGEYGPPWVSAVDTTSNQVLLLDGDPITTFYSSSNGGHTEDSGYVFVTSLPYLPAQKDTFDDYQNPFGSWRRDYTGDEIGRWIDREPSVPNVGSVTDVEITGNIGESGRVDRATVIVTGTNRTIEISGNTFRNVINAGVASEGGGLSRQILSTKYTATVVGAEDPVGGLDKANRRKANPRNIRVAGWVFDEDSANPVPVEIRVDNKVVATITTGETRFDIDTIFGQGQSRGFDTVVSANKKAHQVCAYADNVGTGEKMLLGCELVPRA